MEKIYKKINTEIGYIGAKRNAIYLDSFEQDHNSLILKGEVSSSCCDECFRDYRWYKYQLKFNEVKEYQAVNIEDFYKKKIKTESTFSEVLDDLNSEVDFKTIIIETYDWAYIIVCKSFKFAIIDHR